MDKEGSINKQTPESFAVGHDIRPRLDGQSNSMRLKCISDGLESRHDDISIPTDSCRRDGVGADDQFEHGLAPFHSSSAGDQQDDSASKMAFERIVLNIGGERFATFTSTISCVPGTRLSCLTPSDPSYDEKYGEFFFDRNSKLFPYILDYYRTGELHFPHDLCGPVIKKEMDFWRINEECIAQCCWKTYQEHEEEQRTLQFLANTFGDTSLPGAGRGVQATNGRMQKRMLACSKWRQDVWLFLEEPASSLAAQIWSYFYIVLVVLSIGVSTLNTHPACRYPVEEDEAPQVTPDMFSNASAAGSPARTMRLDETNPKLIMYLTTEPHPALSITDYVLTFVFSVELLLKFVVWPGKLSFFKSFFNIMDLLATVPLLVNAVGNLVRPWFWVETDIYLAYFFTSFACIFRAIRILKLVKHNRGLQVMYLAIRASLREIMLLVLLIIIGTLIFSTMIYFAEFSQEDNFMHIPIGYWWAIVTMTTVGYGDVVPKTGAGYAVGSLCAMCGMLITGLPIPVIANSFRLYYAYAGTRKRNERKARSLSSVR